MASLFKRHYSSFNFLRSQNSIDSKCERAIKKVLKNSKKLAILGGPKSGKDSLKEACLDYSFHGLHKNPLVLPTIQATTLPGVFKSSLWKKFSRAFKQWLGITPLRFQKSRDV